MDEDDLESLVEQIRTYQWTGREDDLEAMERTFGMYLLAVEHPVCATIARFVNAHPERFQLPDVPFEADLLTLRED